VVFDSWVSRSARKQFRRSTARKLRIVGTRVTWAGLPTMLKAKLEKPRAVSAPAEASSCLLPLATARRLMLRIGYVATLEISCLAAPKAYRWRHDGRTPSGAADSRRGSLDTQSPCAFRQRPQLGLPPSAQTTSLDVLIKVLPDARMRPAGVALSHRFTAILRNLRPVPAACKDPKHAIEKLAIGDGVGLPRLWRKEGTNELPFEIRELAIAFVDLGRLLIHRCIGSGGGQNDRIRVDAQRLQFRAAV